MPKNKQVDVGVLNVFKANINNPVQNRNTIPLVFQAVVSKGAQPLFIKYDDLKKRYPYILIDFLQQKISINAIKQANLQASPKNEQETSSNDRQDNKICKQSQDMSYDDEESSNQRSRKIQIRITRNMSKLQEASISSKRWITQTGKAVKVLPKAKQQQQKRQEQRPIIKQKKNELIYDESLMQQKYAYNKLHYKNVISKGILHTKNRLPPQTQISKQQKTKQNEFASNSRSKSNSKARSRKKIGRK